MPPPNPLVEQLTTRELQILTTRVPGIRQRLAAEVVGFVQKLRRQDLFKRPGVAETIDWARTLHFLGETDLGKEAASDTLGAVVKERDDLELVRDNLADITSGG